MDDAQDQYDAIGVEHVVHDAVVTNPQSMEGVGGPVQRLDGLSFDPVWLGHVTRQLFK